MLGHSWKNLPEIYPIKHLQCTRCHKEKIELEIRPGEDWKFIRIYFEFIIEGTRKEAETFVKDVTKQIQENKLFIERPEGTALIRIDKKINVLINSQKQKHQVLITFLNSVNQEDKFSIEKTNLLLPIFTKINLLIQEATYEKELQYKWNPYIAKERARVRSIIGALNLDYDFEERVIYSKGSKNKNHIEQEILGNGESIEELISRVKKGKGKIAEGKQENEWVLKAEQIYNKWKDIC